jgi:DNA topoisomerase-2
MSKTKKLKTTSYSKNIEYTSITFKPDLERFSMFQFDDDKIALLKKRVYDMARCV